LASRTVGGSIAWGILTANQLKLVERFTRRDFGHMDVAMTIDDSKTYTATVHLYAALDAAAGDRADGVLLHRKREEPGATSSRNGKKGQASPRSSHSLSPN
jgi:hypothetical protein